MTIATVIMAAGKGTRMKSKLPKVLHKVAGKPLVNHAVALASRIGDAKPVVIVGHGADDVKASLGETAQFALQADQLGTGHAVMQTEGLLKGNASQVLVWAADMPLLTAATLQTVIDRQANNSGPLTMTTIIAEDPRGFGRIVRLADGGVAAIVEDADCTPEQREIKELNVGVYCFDADWLWENLHNIEKSPKGEYYLTDLVAMAVAQDLRVDAVILEDNTEAIGINTRVHLAEAEKRLRTRINIGMMEAGVTLVDPDTTYIGVDVTIGADTVILPNTMIEGATAIGENCTVGPNSIIRDCTIGNHCEIEASVLEEATMENNVDIGPFGHLRKGAHLADGVHMGNFGEIKKSYLGPGVKVGHFSYIGDATIGANTNIGAGTITCNFSADHKKHRTEIGEDVFIGSDSMLVAPLTIGDRARTGAGSVVTKNVPEDATAVGVPARVLRKRS